MSDQLFNRAQILLQQQKYTEAGKILSDLLAINPTDVDVLALLSEVKLQQDKTDEADELISSAIGLSPATDYLYYIKAKVALNKKKYNDAESFLQQAVSLNPYSDPFWAFWAAIKLERKQYNDALDMANRSLEIDPENILGLNTRSTALLKLNKKDESFNTIEGALREDPHNAYTHANYGWGLLEKGDNKKALDHFREALRNDPNMDYAQAGMIQALKARYLFYRIFLKYSFWMSNLTAKYQWTVIIGIYIGGQLLKRLADANPALRPYLTPVIILLALIAFSTWIITPLSNMFLRFNTFGKHLLGRNEIMSSNFVCVSLLTAITGGIATLVTHNESWLTVAVFGLGMMIPFSVMFSRARFKYGLFIYAGAMVVTGALGIYEAFTTGDIFNLYGTIFLIGLVAFQWLANFLVIREDNY